jgi:hypothetical protein
VRLVGLFAPTIHALEVVVVSICGIHWSFLVQKASNSRSVGWAVATEVPFLEQFFYFVIQVAI